MIFVAEPTMIFLMTFICSMSSLATGLIFGIPGPTSVTAGVIAGRFIGRFGGCEVLVVGLDAPGRGLFHRCSWASIGWRWRS
ncbi:hypothetical protein ACFQ0B_78315 [Nonomuraea thailandensis]